ncbi:lytic polysaccharide monooxygenase [Aplosporella prunicola CBS 121167]|uniref:AA9 family lytic polysaccharide monooxygenase n=1 Tax=Aplosporella prunicola CBS 121167 TaxID=1176127 RepID=A0A6A6BM17_9PEZI|nr:lytic polysaccharide monooxygenase [Aplosporella prunicola CBS 121167]KAF2144718.1 lytic polysaccharide monooxygenase [Aplosporella prunicola CBS 121167]
MKITSILPIACAAAAHAHTIFQRLSVNGVDQGQLTGVRAPDSNNPITSVTGDSIACNTGIHSPVSQSVVTIPAGATVGAYWQHLLGTNSANDADNPIAASHKGPVLVYLAKVDNAATTTTSGLKWFKIAEDGLDTSSGTWGVDRMIANGGWQYFTLPSCVAPGQYLMRVEIIALHSAYSTGGAQFYISCAQINVSGSGTSTGTSSVSFPGAYSATDPGILINIYGASGQPDNDKKPYTIPGPAVLAC